MTLLTARRSRCWHRWGFYGLLHGEPAESRDRLADGTGQARRGSGDGGTARRGASPPAWCWGFRSRAAGRLMNKILYGVAATDPGMHGMQALLLLSRDRSGGCGSGAVPRGSTDGSGYGKRGWGARGDSACCGLIGVFRLTTTPRRWRLGCAQRGYPASTMVQCQSGHTASRWCGAAAGVRLAVHTRSRRGRCGASASAIGRWSTTSSRVPQRGILTRREDRHWVDAEGRRAGCDRRAGR
jgi:hypothetical protein